MPGLHKLLVELSLDGEEYSLSPVDKFLDLIVHWKPKWLDDKKYDNQSPALYEGLKLIKTSLIYDSYDNYYETAYPLLIEECWFVLKKGNDDEDEKNTPVRTIYLLPFQSLSDSCERQFGRNTVQITVYAQEVIEKAKVKKDLSSCWFDYEGTCPMRGDFVKIQQSKKHIPDMFAYIMERGVEVTDRRDKCHVLYKYKLLIKSDAFHTDQLHNIKLTTVTSILSHVTLVRALVGLKWTKLRDFILHPKIEAYEMPLISDCKAIANEDKLNAKQMEVVTRVSESINRQNPRICLIQGPPGTGKSRVIVNIITKMVRSNEHKRILVCAPSNKAIDEIVLRLLEVRNLSQAKGNDFKIVRVGRKSKMHKIVAKTVSLSTLVDREIEKIVLNRKMKSMKTKKRYNKKIDRKPIERRILWSADVIATTLSSSYNQIMEYALSDSAMSPSICIVDEAGQAKELETMIPLLLGVKTLVLVGDPKQLPPTILSQKAKIFGFDESLFSRAEKIFTTQSKNPIVMLDTQYRMVPAISQWPNDFFYDGALKNAAIVPPMTLVNYKILNHSSRESQTKFTNAGEARLIVNVVSAIIAQLTSTVNVEKKLTLGIITPYKDQRKLIDSLLKDRLAKLPKAVKDQFDDISPNTVDSFQGQERDIIVMSCVRSNNGIGFVKDPNRLCVSLTRAKHSLIVCGNFETFEKNQMWKSLLSDAKSRDTYKDIKYNIKAEGIKKLGIFNSLQI